MARKYAIDPERHFGKVALHDPKKVMHDPKKVIPQRLLFFFKVLRKII